MLWTTKLTQATGPLHVLLRGPDAALTRPDTYKACSHPLQSRLRCHSGKLHHTGLEPHTGAQTVWAGGASAMLCTLLPHVGLC